MKTGPTGRDRERDRDRGKTRLDGKRVLALGASVGLSVAFWDTRALWPLKMLVVMMHESGHAIGALLVGGSPSRIEISANVGGHCISSIPDTFWARVVVASSGYVGSVVAAALLLVLTYRYGWRRGVLGASSLWLGATGLWLGGDLFTVLFCLGAAAALGAAAKWLSASAVEWVNLFLAAFSTLFALSSLKDHLWNSEVRAMSDAGILAGSTVVPALVWAFLWSLASLGVMALALWWSFRPRRHGSPQAAPRECRRVL